MKPLKHILVAPLNWGLGHATRCIPIISALITKGHRVTVASDGQALELLKKEFPTLNTLTLPSYNVKYAKNKKDFKRKILLQTVHIYKTIRAERSALKKIISDSKIDAVISDSRFGLYSTKVPSIIISHQLTVFSGKTTKLTSSLHRRYLTKFDECWVPDHKGIDNLCGRLSNPFKKPPYVRYIGPLSRMKRSILPQQYDIMIMASGPEPQRSMLEEMLLSKLKNYNGKVLLVQGIIGKEQRRKQLGTIEIVNFLTTRNLEKAINQSGFIISRSGYTTIMDLAAMGKKAFFIPTPGQPEQEYLAKYLSNKGIVPFVSQDEFEMNSLSNVNMHTGFKTVYDQPDLSELLSLLEGKGELRTNTKFTFNINFFLVRLNNMFNNREPQT